MQTRCSTPTFFLTLTNHARAIRNVVDRWRESGDPRNPFQHVVFTPLFSGVKTIEAVRWLREVQGSVVMFDSGGYQVQMGKAKYDEMFGRLVRFHCENDWAHWYVLPDNVPHSADSEREVEFKVRETLDFARLFMQKMPDGFAERGLGVVHGRTKDQVRRCVETYFDAGLRYIGFGSFGTSGFNGSVNMVSQGALELLRVVQSLARQGNLRLHIFGIGSPNRLARLVEAGISPNSFDSAGWWKAGGFGKVFFPGGCQLHVTRIDNRGATQQSIEHEKRRTNHRCPFCADTSRLRRTRELRVMHNLAAMLETVERIGDS